MFEYYSTYIIFKQRNKSKSCPHPNFLSDVYIHVPFGISNSSSISTKSPPWIFPGSLRLLLWNTRSQTTVMETLWQLWQIQILTVLWYSELQHIYKFSFWRFHQRRETFLLEHLNEPRKKILNLASTQAPLPSFSCLGLITSPPEKT